MTNRKTQIILITLGVVSSIYLGVQCYGRYTVFSGVVVDKQFRAAYTQITTTTVYNLTIETSTPQIQTIYHPDRWSIDIEGTNAAANFTTSNWAVPEHEYDIIKIGDYWSASDDGR